MNQAENLHEGLKNRKRFKCSKCNQYTLHIGRGRYECENKCILKEEQIKSILKANDYNDYYLTKDLEELFQYDFYYKSNISKRKTETSFFSSSENEKMNKIAHQTIQINNLLDDSAIAYFRKFPNKEIREQGLTHYEYLANLVEDISVSLNRMSKDMMLMDIAYQYKGELLFSVSYFYFNLSEHFYESIERIFFCLGIMFDIHFAEATKRNTRKYILEELKKNDNYNESDIKLYVLKILSNNAFKELIGYRESSTHDLTNNISTVLGKKIDLNRDRREIDKDLIKGKVKDIISVLDFKYDLLKKIIEQLENFYLTNFDVNAIKMLKTTGVLAKFVIKDNRQYIDICKDEYEKNETRLFKLMQYNKDSNTNYVNDVIFRMFEILKGCSYAICFDDSSFKKHWKEDGIEFVLSSMDRQYLIYSCATRIFACYDKIARYLCNKYKLVNSTKKIYFDTFLSDIQEKNEILLLCESVRKTDVYLFLTDYRNQIVHTARKGCIYLKAMEEYEDYLLIAILYNSEKIGKIIDEIIKS